MNYRGQKTINIDGKDYWTVKSFSLVTGRSVTQIRSLMWKGNTVRKLKVDHFDKKPFIPAEELFEFPFVLPGSNKVYKGIMIERFYTTRGLLRSKEEVLEECTSHPL